MALTPERIAELERLKALMQPLATEAQRKAQAIWNAEQAAKQVPGKKNGGLEKFLKHSKVKERLYHGTDKSFSKFKPKNGMIFLAPKPDFANDYTTSNPYTVEKRNLSPNVMPVHVHTKNPWDYKNPEHVDALHQGLVEHPHIGPEFATSKGRLSSGDWTAIEDPAIQETIRKLGHDSFYVNEGGYRNLGMYDRRNIKSATGNRGTYDRRSSDITKADGGQVSTDAMRLALMGKGGKPPAVTKVTKKSDDRIPELEEAARALLAGEINRTAYDRILKQLKPVRPYTSVPAPATDDEALNALYENKRDKWRANHFQAGDPVGMRLDIPSYQQHGVWVNSLHDEGGKGLPTSYAPVSSVRNAVFDAKPSQAQRVATGETKKSPFAKIKGEWHPIEEQEALAQMQEYLDHPEWHQIGMDPRRRDYFYSRKDSRKPVTHAEHVLQIGPLVLAKNPTFGKRKDFGLAKGGSVTHAHHLEIEERPL